MSKVIPYTDNTEKARIFLKHMGYAFCKCVGFRDAKWILESDGTIHGFGYPSEEMPELNTPEKMLNFFKADAELRGEKLRYYNDVIQFLNAIRHN